MKNLIFILILIASALGLAHDAQAFYNPSAGRWLSRDPIGERGGKNVYGFLNNAPPSRLDSLGLKGWETICMRCKADSTTMNNVGAAAACEAYQLTAKNGNVEYCGMLCHRCIDGKNDIIRTGPIRGTELKDLPPGYGGQCDPLRVSCPSGYKPVGSYHSHPMTEGDEASSSDRAFAKDYGPIYIGFGTGTGCGGVVKYDATHGRSNTLPPPRTGGTVPKR